MVEETSTKQKPIWGVDPAHTTVEFGAKHMMIFTVKGRFARFDFNVDFDDEHPEASKVDAVIHADSLDTKEAQRDTHLRSPDFLWVEKYPTITFKSTRIERAGSDRYKIWGDLTIRGIARQVSLDATLSSKVKDPWGNWHVAFEAEATLNRKDFGLTWNVALEAGGVLVGDSARITIEGELVTQKQ